MRSQILLIALFASAVTHAQDPTYRQLAVEHKGQVGVSVTGCGWAGPPLAGIAGRADLAIEGMIVSRRTYATQDDRFIFTAYEVSTKQVIFQRIVPTTSMPGPPLPTIFKTQGGTVVFDGYPFTLSVNNGRAQLDPGDHVVLFGQYDKSDGSWVFSDRDFLRVSDNVVINTLPSFDKFPEGLEPRMPIELFAQKVRDLAR